MRIAVYCPDRHLTYDGRTPDQRGVGGGVTARIRVSTALARRGNQVTVICNCPRPITHERVRYTPLDSVHEIDTDVLVMHTTGDQLDLRPLLQLTVRSRLHVVFVDGVDAPKGMTDVRMDHLIAPSNFIRDIAREQWGVDRNKIFVSHHGVQRSFFQPSFLKKLPERTLHRIAYATHPSKGFDAALEVLHLLRTQDSRFELHVFGGYGLWGQKQTMDQQVPGLVKHGLVGQKDLSWRLMECGFALYLQNRAEPFGIAIAEGLVSGCVTVASPAGAHPEIIDQGRSGFLVEGDPADPATHQRAADIILNIGRNPAFAKYISENARQVPLDWDLVAESWEQYWAWFLDNQSGIASFTTLRCPECSGQWLPLADGYHCAACGRYSRNGVH
jgi:glycosyltransferase involved in cell wall biosynthesis